MWNDTIVLLSPKRMYQDEYGAWHEGRRSEREVFCNVGTLGLVTMAQLRSSEVRITSGDSAPSIGMREMHVVWIRAIDYDGEDQVIFRGKEMDVIALTSEGERYKMIIARKYDNV